MLDFLTYELFPAVLRMGLTASVVILCVLVARLALRRAPKIFSYALWAVVLFRLLCPVSIPAGFSLLGVVDEPIERALPAVAVVEQVRPDPAPVHQAQTGDMAPAEVPQAQPSAPSPLAVAAWIWLAGVAGMALYSIFSLIRLRRRLVGAVPLERGVFLADHIQTPFVLGLVRPRIYLPSALPEREREHILLHERHHIRRGDHVVKVAAFVALSIYWFHPLVWVSFLLAGRDMEMSCDEAVVKQLGEGIRADYSASLLSLATGRPIISGAPLAFGEGDTAGRIKNLLRWKKPKLWITILAAAACVAVIAACAADPRETEEPETGGRYASMEDFAQQTMAAAREVEYYSASGEEATAQVTGTKLAWLDKQGEVEGLAPEGTLEAWTFNYLVQVDVPAEEIMLVGGMYEEDGWFDLEGQGGHDVVALRYPDGSYEILYDEIVNDGSGFLGYHHSYEEAIYDWYVQEKALDLPLYVEDWTEQIAYPDGEYHGDFPVHRYDGDGWYIYIPVTAWTQWAAEPDHSVWTSDYNTGSTLTVDRIERGLPEPEPGDGGTYHYYDVDTADGGCWRIATRYLEAELTDYPYIAIQPQVLQLMAESFTLDEFHYVDDGGDESALAMSSVLQGLSWETSRLVWVRENRESELALSGETIEALRAAAEELEPVEDPEAYLSAYGGAYLYPADAEGRHISLFAEQPAPTVLFRYVGDDVNESALAEDPQLYLYLTACGEAANAQFHDLDGDGLLEALVWPDREPRGLVIWDWYDDQLQRLDVNEALGAETSDYAGLIGDLPQGQREAVAATVDGVDGTYFYADGVLRLPPEA